MTDKVLQGSNEGLLDPIVSPEAIAAAEVAESASGRLLSLDALRGFDMFWIVGAEELVHSLNKVSTNGVTGFLSTQLSHVEWDGFHFYDLIFPLFVFMSGVSITFSLDKIVEHEGRGAALGRVFRRFLLLFALGIMYSGGLSRLFPEIRVLGVLQRIATSYFFASLLYLYLPRRGLVAAFIALMLGYWAFLTFVPVPPVPELTAVNPAWGLGGTGTAMGNNWANYIDYHYLIGRRYDTYWDPEGILSILPAIGSALLGVFAGLLVRNKEISAAKKAIYLILAGSALVVVGTLWGYQFPVIKKIWTSTFVLVAGGYSCILLGAFMMVIDVWGFKKWTTPFVWIGCNALAIYLGGRFIDFEYIAEFFVGGSVKLAAGIYGDLLVTVVTMTLLFIFARFLYKRQIFLRL